MHLEPKHESGWNIGLYLYRDCLSLWKHTIGIWFSASMPWAPFRSFFRQFDRKDIQPKLCFVLSIRLCRADGPRGSHLISQSVNGIVSGWHYALRGIHQMGKKSHTIKLAAENPTYGWKKYREGARGETMFSSTNPKRGLGSCSGFAMLAAISKMWLELKVGQRLATARNGTQWNTILLLGVSWLLHKRKVERSCV